MQGPFKNRLLPESAALEAVILAWPFADSDWRDSLKEAEACYRQILSTFLIYLNNIEIVVILHPSICFESWQKKINAMVADKSRLKVIRDIDYDDTWIRDYGPLSRSSSYFSFTFDGWGKKYPATKDNNVAQQLLELLGLSPLETSRFVAEGGALEINPNGYLLANLDCLVSEKRNPGWSQAQVEEHLERCLGVTRFFWLDGVDLSGDDTDGHIDTLARFSESKGILCCGENPEHPDKLALSRLNTQVAAICDTLGWQHFKLPVPQVFSALDGRLLPGSYANFLVAESIVFLPIYGAVEDDLAEEVLRQAFPSYRIVPLDCRALLEQHGSLHCATMQVAKIKR